MITAKLSSKGILVINYGAEDRFTLDFFYTAININVFGSIYDPKVLLGTYKASEVKKIVLQEKITTLDITNDQRDTKKPLELRG